jgi:hypothetical protein
VEECELRLNARGRVKGRHAACEAHNASPVGGTTGGSGHGADALGCVEEHVPKLLGAWPRDDDASLGRAVDQRGEGGPDADAPAHGSAL